MKIIIVDDEQVIREALFEYLTQEGHECKIASSGYEALALISKSKPEVVLTDYNMPVMNGIELLKIVRERYSEIRVIIFTGYADIENAISAINYGAYAFFRKPLDLEDLSNTLKIIDHEMKNKIKDRLSRQELIKEYSRLRAAFSALQYEITHNDRFEGKHGTK